MKTGNGAREGGCHVHGKPVCLCIMALWKDLASLNTPPPSLVAVIMLTVLLLLRVCVCE